MKSAIESFFHNGFSLLEIPGELDDLLSHALICADRFFSREVVKKCLVSNNSIPIRGYKSIDFNRNSGEYKESFTIGRPSELYNNSPGHQSFFPKNIWPNDDYEMRRIFEESYFEIEKYMQTIARHKLFSDINAEYTLLNIMNDHFSSLRAVRYHSSAKNPPSKAHKDRNLFTMVYGRSESIGVLTLVTAAGVKRVINLRPRSCVLIAGIQMAKWSGGAIYAPLHFVKSIHGIMDFRDVVVFFQTTNPKYIDAFN